MLNDTWGIDEEAGLRTTQGYTHTSTSPSTPTEVIQGLSRPTCAGAIHTSSMGG